MDDGEAYQRLGIDDRTLGADLILQIYTTRGDDQPSRVEDYKKALMAIGKHTGNREIESYLAGVDPTAVAVTPDRPVGLENIGNTCYLNSLLQFYFTVTELRNIVLNFNEYKMEMSLENVSRKQVGSRKVTAAEIERAQRCKYPSQIGTTGKLMYHSC